MILNIVNTSSFSQFLTHPNAVGALKSHEYFLRQIDEASTRDIPALRERNPFTRSPDNKISFESYTQFFRQNTPKEKLNVQPKAVFATAPFLSKK